MSERFDATGKPVTGAATPSQTYLAIGDPKNGSGAGPGGGPTMGTATLDFGAFPGASDASVAVTGQAGIASSSKVMAWIFPADTPEHSADEHTVETLAVYAMDVVAGTGFTIRGVNTCPIMEPVAIQAVNARRTGGNAPATFTDGGLGTRLYGRWNIGWLWQ